VPNVSIPSFPSKIVDYCAAGLPVIVCIEDASDAGDIVAAANAGIKVAAGDEGALAQAIETMWQEHEQGTLAARGNAARALFVRELKHVQGPMENYGLPKPDHRFGDAHPTVSDDILSRIAHGEIAPKPNIARLTERTVVFADGSEVEADIVIYCTGYRVTFPFFAPDLIAAPDNDLPLFRRVFHPRIPSVAFIGLLQPLGAIMPLAAAQSEWVCDYLSGRYALPDPEAMRADMEAERARMFKRYVASKRHTMQVDYDDYLADLAKERRRGAERARAIGNRLPVPPAAAEAAAA